MALKRISADNSAGTLPQRLQQLEAILQQKTRRKPDLASLAGAVLRLQRGLTGTRELVNKQPGADTATPATYMDDPDLLSAYLSYYWPVSYTQIRYILQRLEIQAQHVLDLGSGPGPMSAALFDWMTEQDRSGQALPSEQMPQLTLLDSSAKALQLAEEILSTTASRFGLPAAELRCITANLAEAALPPGPYDLIVFGHSLNELGAGLPDWQERRLNLIRRAAALLAPGGCLLLIEPALLRTARDLIQLRDSLLSDQPDDKTGQAGLPGQTRSPPLELLGPCTCPIPCPAFIQGENQTCHEEFGWAVPPLVASLAEKAGLERQRIKMAWFAFRRPQPEAAASSAASTQDASYRVVSEPMLNKAGRIRYLICGAAGRFPVSAKTGDPLATAAGFFQLTRGAYIRIEQPEIRESGWGIQSATRLIRLDDTN